MNKVNKKTSDKRVAAKGHISRGTKIGRATVIGIARDGTIIFQPLQRPANTTPAKIRAAVKAVKEQHRSEKTLATS